MARPKKATNVAATATPFDFEAARKALSNVQVNLDTVNTELTNRERELRALNDEHAFRVAQLKELVAFEGEVASLNDLRTKLDDERQKALTDQKQALANLAEEKSERERAWKRTKEEFEYEWKLKVDRQKQEHADRERALVLRENELEDLRSQVEELNLNREMELDEARAEAAAATSRDMRDKHTTEVNQLNNKIGLLEAQLGLKDTRINDLIEEVERLKEEVKSVRADANATVREALQAGANRESRVVYASAEPQTRK